MIMVSKKHQSLSGEKAQISQRIGGKFTAWGSHLSGINLVLKQRKLFKHGARQAGGRITTRLQFLTSPRSKVVRNSNSPRSAFPLIDTAVITEDVSRPTGHL